MENIREKSYEMLDELYGYVASKVQEIQGDKEYIDTQHKHWDAMLFYGYTDFPDITERICEGVITGIRVNGKEVEILGTSCDNIVFTEADFKKTIENYNNNEEYDSWENCWQPIRGNMLINYAPTLFSIAEFIEEYDG